MEIKRGKAEEIRLFMIKQALEFELNGMRLTRGAPRGFAIIAAEYGIRVKRSPQGKRAAYEEFCKRFGYTPREAGRELEPDPKPTPPTLHAHSGGQVVKYTVEEREAAGDAGAGYVILEFASGADTTNGPAGASRWAFAPVGTPAARAIEAIGGVDNVTQLPFLRQIVLAAIFEPEFSSPCPDCAGPSMPCSCHIGG